MQLLLTLMMDLQLVPSELTVKLVHASHFFSRNILVDVETSAFSKMLNGLLRAIAMEV